MSLEIAFRTSPLEAFATALGRLPFAWEQDGNVYEPSILKIPYRLPTELHRRAWRHCPPVWITNPLVRDHCSLFRGAAHSHKQLGLLQ